jgi:hypothetical protein
VWWLKDLFGYQDAVRRAEKVAAREGVWGDGKDAWIRRRVCAVVMFSPVELKQIRDFLQRQDRGRAREVSGCRRRFVAPDPPMPPPPHRTAQRHPDIRDEVRIGLGGNRGHLRRTLAGMGRRLVAVTGSGNTGEREMSEQAAPEYEVKTFADFEKIPDDRLEDCLQEFCAWVTITRYTKRLLMRADEVLNGENRVISNVIGTESFVWIDDGLKTATLSFNVAPDSQLPATYKGDNK